MVILLVTVETSLLPGHCKITHGPLFLHEKKATPDRHEKQYLILVVSLSSKMMLVMWFPL